MAKKHRRIIKRAARKYGISPRTLNAVWGVESGYATHGKSVSSAGAQGPFQFMPATARSYGINPHKFRQSAFAAAKYLGSSKRAGRSFGRMLSDYNAGAAGAYQPDYVAAVRAKLDDWEPVKGGRPRRGAQKARTRSVTDLKRIPGVDRSDQRRALLMSYLDDRDKPGALLSLAGGLREAVDTQSRLKAVKRTVKVKGRAGRAGPGGGGKVHGGGGWAGTKGIAYAATEGMPRGSQKRPTKMTASGNISDHWSGSKDTYAIDVPAAGATGDQYARRMAKRLGIKGWQPGSYTGHVITAAGGKRYRVQILWKVEGHYDHVHVGVSRV